MNITIVQGAFMPVPPMLGSAVEKIWFALGKEFVRRGHSVTHISRELPPLKKEEHIDGVHHVRIPGFDHSRSLVTLKWHDLVYSRRVLRVLPRADILVTNTFWLPMLAPATKTGKIYVHVARYPKGQMKFYGKAARLQTVSTVIRNAVCREVPKLASRVKIIPNFVSPSRETPATNKREKAILYVGRIHPEKAVHLLIEAFAKLVSSGVKDWRLRLVGPWEFRHGGGGAEYLKLLHKKAQGVEEQIDWVGPIFDSVKLSSYYRQSSFFVYPSVAARGEASPLAPLEAMAEGCPPVVSSLECFRDYLQPESNGWTFDERAPDASANLAARLQSIVSDGGMLRRVGEKAFSDARKYSLANVGDAYLSDFQELVSQ